MPSLALSSILDPMATDRFFAEYYGQNVLHVSGYPGRFASLLPWSALNEILRTDDLRYPRMRLLQDNKPAEQRTYLNEVPGETSPLTLSVAKLNRQLREGATLVINAIDLLYEPIALLANELSSTFKARVAANLYAGWRTSSASGIHGDDHNIIVVQIAGKKHWRVYRKTTSFAVDPSDATRANESPVWDRILNDGDILHVPKDWPHVAVPCDEPTLHLTLSVFEYNALNLLNWLVAARLSNDKSMHLAIPSHTDADHQCNYLSGIRAKLHEAFSEPDLVDGFFRDQVWLVSDKAQRFTGKAATRPFFGLPWSATPRGVPDTGHGSYLICLASPFGLEGFKDEKKIELRFDREVFNFDPSMLPVFQSLETDAPYSIAEFFQRFSSQFERGELEQFLGRLINIGIVVVRAKRP